jgi:hypothetical protein
MYIRLQRPMHIIFNRNFNELINVVYLNIKVRLQSSSVFKMNILLTIKIKTRETARYENNFKNLTSARGNFSEVIVGFRFFFKCGE